MPDDSVQRSLGRGRVHGDGDVSLVGCCWPHLNHRRGADRRADLCSGVGCMGFKKLLARNRGPLWLAALAFIAGAAMILLAGFGRFL